MKSASRKRFFSYTDTISLILLVSVVLLTSACSTPDNKVFKQRAQIIAEKLIKDLAEQKYADSIQYYDKIFFERISPAAWQKSLAKVGEKLGTYQSHKITASSVQHGFSTRSTATTVLVYRIYFKKSYTIQKFTFMSDEKADKMRLVGHYVDFPEQPK